jgi:hypothetical protein
MSFTFSSLFLLHLLLELYVFPNYVDTLLNPTSVLFLSLLIGVFFVKLNLKRFNRLLAWIIICFDLVIGMTLINKYYNSDFIPFHQVHWIFIYFLTLFSFSLAKESDFRQVKKSGLALPFILLVANITIVYATFYYFKINHLKEISNFELNVSWINSFLKDYTVDFIIIFNALVFVNLLKYRYSPKNKKKYLINILKRLIIFLFASIAFYACYNNTLSDKIFQIVNEYVPHPHNLILYNSIPKQKEQRFRIIVTVLLYLI